MKKIFLILSVFSLCIINLFSQEVLKSIEEEYFDFLSLQGIVERPSLGYRTLSDSVWEYIEDEEESSKNIWKNYNFGTWYSLWEPEQETDNFFTKGLQHGIFLKVYGPELFNSFNTTAPHGQNDGALWQGRGYNMSFSSGLRFEGYGFELTFKPNLSWSQNLDFDYLPGVYGDKHSYNWGGNIDLVQRYGDNPFWNFDLGDSEIRWTWHSLTFGYGYQNPWLGPAMLNPMLGSNNAPGYLKFDAGLRKTNVVIPGIDLDLGYIEGRIWNGKLEESDYFDKNPDNNYRMINAISGFYSPSFIPGFTLGLNRIFLTNWAPHNFKYLLRLFTLSRSNGSQVGTGEDEDQKFSITTEWTYPQVGFTVYGEFGRDDFSASEQCYPFHTAIYTLGFKKEIPLKNNFQSELIIEFNNFEMSQDFQLQWPYMGFYAHGLIMQGYTNKGQILGAGSGYFGNSQYIQYKVYYSNGLFAFNFHRHSPNINSIFSMAVYETADPNISELNEKWYQNFETNYDFVIDFLYILKNSIMINQEVVFTYTAKTMYNPDAIRFNGYYSLSLKWTI